MTGKVFRPVPDLGRGTPTGNPGSSDVRDHRNGAPRDCDTPTLITLFLRVKRRPRFPHRGPARPYAPDTPTSRLSGRYSTLPPRPERRPRSTRSGRGRQGSSDNDWAWGSNRTPGRRNGKSGASPGWTKAGPLRRRPEASGSETRGVRLPRRPRRLRDPTLHTWKPGQTRRRGQRAEPHWTRQGGEGARTQEWKWSHVPGPLHLD